MWVNSGAVAVTKEALKRPMARASEPHAMLKNGSLNHAPGGLHTSPQRLHDDSGVALKATLVLPLTDKMSPSIAPSTDDELWRPPP